MPTASLIAADLVALGVLVFVLYFPRYRRKDIVVATLSLNIGVLAVATALSSASVSAGFGLGLFGVLSIIRLRSSELDQEEVAYYFSSLSLGLLAGFDVEPAWLAPVLMGAILAALYVGDHPRLFVGHRQQNVTLDAAYTDEAALTERLESLLDADVLRLKVRKVNLVNATTSVDVRYRLRSGAVGSPVPPVDPIPPAEFAVESPAD